MMQDIYDVKLKKFINDYEFTSNDNHFNNILFINYHFFSQLLPGRFDNDMDLLERISCQSKNFSEINGVVFLLNDQIITSIQDVDDILSRDKKGLFEIYFLTVGDIVLFQQQVSNIIFNISNLKNNDEWLAIFSYLITDRIVVKWKNDPVLHLVAYNDLDLVKLDINYKIKRSFSKIDYIYLDRDKMKSIILSNDKSYEVDIRAEQNLLISTPSYVPSDVYILNIPADELIKLMVTKEGMLRKNLFDDNVRDFQGVSNVNKEMLATLEECPERFFLYNNGITIVCKKIEIKNGSFHLENPQIVNGCQTCNVIYLAYKSNIPLGKVTVMTKLVGSDTTEITQGIVRGANRQNIVYEEAFEIIKPFHKNLEKYFANISIDGFFKIYYERRSKQYVGENQIKPGQKINFRNLIQSMVAIFLNGVDEAHRHEYILLNKYKNILFVETHSCKPYYLAAFLYLNIDDLFRKKIIPKKYRGYKMHIIFLVKELSVGKSPDINDDRMDLYCDRILERIKNRGLDNLAIEAYEKFQEVSSNWIKKKGEQYRYGLKDSVEFKNFLIQEIRGNVSEEKLTSEYIGEIISINEDEGHNKYGFIEHIPNNIFFHEFDNPNIDFTYLKKKISYRIVDDGGRERAIDIKLLN